MNFAAWFAAQERWLTGKSYTRVSAGLHDVDTIAEALEGVDVLFHTAGVVKARDTRYFSPG